MGQPLADCDFNRAALHPAYPIKRRTSAQRTQASPERRHPEESPALDPLENSIRRKRPECANSGHCPMAWLEGEIDPKPSSECARLPAARGFAVQTPLRRRYPTTEPNSPMRGRHGHSNGERNKRGDDHSDSNCPEPTSEPAFGSSRWAIATFWISRAIALALAASTTPIPKHTKQL